jgi:hypothetical protein
MQNTWSRASANKYGSTDPIWGQLGLVFNQLDGLIQGYNQFGLKNAMLIA